MDDIEQTLEDTLDQRREIEGDQLVLRDDEFPLST